MGVSIMLAFVGNDHRAWSLPAAARASDEMLRSACGRQDLVSANLALKVLPPQTLSRTHGARCLRV